MGCLVPRDVYAVHSFLCLCAGGEEILGLSVFTFCPVHGTVLQYQTLPMDLSGALSGNKKARHNPLLFFVMAISLAV